MKKVHLAFVMALGSGLISGCAQYQWQKQGATQEEFNRDSYQCQMEAASAFPNVVVSHELTAAHQNPAVTNCSTTGSAYGSYGSSYGQSNTSCTTTPGRTVEAVTYTADANQHNRGEAGKACLYARGYQLIKKQQQQQQQPGNDDCRADERNLVSGRWVCR